VVGSVQDKAATALLRALVGARRQDPGQDAGPGHQDEDDEAGLDEGLGLDGHGRFLLALGRHINPLS
jgi:hypothetical protein